MEGNNNTGNNDEFLATLQERLLSGADAVSSSSSNIQKAMRDAMGGISESADASAKRIRLEAGRFKGDILDDADYATQDYAESRSGFATQFTGLRKLVDMTDKRINDIEQRKQELLLQNESNAASQLSALQIEMLKFEQESAQNVFNNLLSISSFGLQAQAFKEGQRQFNLNYELDNERFSLEKEQQSFAEKNAMAQIGLQFGLDVSETDTIDTMVNKAAATGQVDEQRQLELEKLRAEIKNANAQAARALRKDPGDEPFDPITSEILARAYRGGQTEFLAGLRTNEQLSSVISKANELSTQDEEVLTKLASVSGSSSEFIDAVSRLAGGRTPQEKAILNEKAIVIAENTNFGQDGIIEGGMEQLQKELEKAGYRPGELFTNMKNQNSILKN